MQRMLDPKFQLSAEDTAKFVAKLTDGKHTRTMLETLSDAARIEEIARMLGGTEVSDMARSHAAEMLGAATATSKKTTRSKSKSGRT